MLRRETAQPAKPFHLLEAAEAVLLAESEAYAESGAAAAKELLNGDPRRPFDDDGRLNNGRR